MPTMGSIEACLRPSRPGLKPWQLRSATQRGWTSGRDNAYSDRSAQQQQRSPLVWILMGTATIATATACGVEFHLIVQQKFSRFTATTTTMTAKTPKKWGPTQVIANEQRSFSSEYRIRKLPRNATVICISKQCVRGDNDDAMSMMSSFEGVMFVFAFFAEVSFKCQSVRWMWVLSILMLNEFLNVFCTGISFTVQ